MNLLKRLWNWLVRKTSTSPKLAVVDGIQKPQSDSIEEIFVRVCSNQGVGSKTLEQINATRLFAEWFTGEATDECVLGCIPEFLETHSAVNAKLQRFFK